MVGRLEWRQQGQPFVYENLDRYEECSLRDQCGIEKNRLNILGKDSLDQDPRQDNSEWN